MKTKKLYVKPDVDVVNIELDSSIANPSGPAPAGFQPDSKIYIPGNSTGSEVHKVTL